MNRDEMKNRTKQFALRIIRLSAALPKLVEADVLGRQVLKSGTSIGANYREAIRASSRRHFVTNLEICLREGDETLYWLELLVESGIVHQSAYDLLDECNQLVAIMTATVQPRNEIAANADARQTTAITRKS